MRKFFERCDFLTLRCTVRDRAHKKTLCRTDNESFQRYYRHDGAFIVIYVTYAVGYILQREVTKTERCKMPTALVMY
jgi:hypothetical protein